jgi:hypothetical protein
MMRPHLLPRPPAGPAGTLGKAPGPRDAEKFGQRSCRNKGQRAKYCSTAWNALHAASCSVSANRQSASRAKRPVRCTERALALFRLDRNVNVEPRLQPPWTARPSAALDEPMDVTKVRGLHQKRGPLATPR